MDLEILSWNLADGLSFESKARGIIDVVKAQKPTVAVFPEAWQEGETKYLDLSLEEFDKAGYETSQVLYEDLEQRSDRHGFLGIYLRGHLEAKYRELSEWPDEMPYICR